MSKPPLADRIKAWRDNDAAGYDGAITLLCDAEDELRRTCTWRRDVIGIIDDEDVYVSGCGETWQFNDGGPKENKMRYCPYCGGALVVQVPERADAEEDDDA